MFFKLVKLKGTFRPKQEFEWDDIRFGKLKDSGKAIIRHTLKIKPEHKGVWVPMGFIQSYDVGRTLIIDKHEDGRYIDHIVD